MSWFKIRLQEITTKSNFFSFDFEEPNSVSEQFNKFFVEIGQDIANDANSETSNDNFRIYLTKSVNSTIVFNPPQFS